MRVETKDGAAANPSLSRIGLAQADQASDWLVAIDIDAIYSSPLQRARETAAPFAKRSGLKIGIEDDVSEFDRDSSTYIPMEELKAQNYEAWKAFVDGGYGDDVDVLSFQATVVRGIESIIDRHPGERVAVFCHGGVVNMWASHVLETPPRLFIDVGYASVSRFLCASTGERSLVSLNETQHLTG
ncbi:MAG: histidine phosphatase family protein [Pseudomonadales bacterium]|nr:histidine phosphatase family protein [Pseudomonadales bacterium]